MFVTLANKANEEEATAACDRLAKQFPDRKFSTQPKVGSSYRFEVGVDGPIGESDLGAMRPVANEK